MLSFLCLTSQDEQVAVIIEQGCSVFLQQINKQLEEKVASKGYSKQGGYEEYQQDLTPLIEKCDWVHNLGEKVTIPCLIPCYCINLKFDQSLNPLLLIC